VFNENIEFIKRFAQLTHRLTRIIKKKK